LWDLAQLIVQIAGSGSCRLAPFPTERKAIDLGNFYADYSKISRALGWRPVTSLRAGLLKTMAYYRRCREQYWETAVVQSPLR
ncbi:MAG: NAD(P)-dependent oxidoreductase, partial [Chloroflexi bacterium]|nr:NAD(P)-dependent oxidoreductase [Chloroflexota bacterium]